jgi:hypothetical protein
LCLFSFYAHDLQVWSFNHVPEILHNAIVFLHAVFSLSLSHFSNTFALSSSLDISCLIWSRWFQLSFYVTYRAFCFQNYILFFWDFHIFVEVPFHVLHCLPNFIQFFISSLN